MLTEYQIETISATIGMYIIGPAIVGFIIYLCTWLSTKIKFKYPHALIEKTALKNDKIQEILTEFRVLFQANRTYLTLFHNGDKFVDNSSIYKYSRTNESVMEGYSYDANYYQNISVSLVHDEMKLMIDDNPIFLYTKDLSDGKFKRMLIARGIKVFIRCVVKKQNDILGFIGADYHYDIKPPENLKEVSRYSDIIEEIMSNK